MTQWIFQRDRCNCSSESNPENRKDKTVSLERMFANPSSKEPTQEEEFATTDLPFMLERYKPLRYIARSTASVVYKCFDRQLCRLVAIKTLSFPDPEDLIRFQQEARATGLLKHPNIVEVLDFGIGSSGTAYMVLEFVEATNLEDWLQTQGQLREREVLDLMEGVLRALDFAHRKGIFHRDLKPQNILIGNNREPKLIDFGLALMLDPEQSISDTRGLSLVGTPQYMGPDQFLGRPYDARSEIYSLGCVFFACLTGSPPFQGEDALQLASQHAKVQAPNLHEINPNRQYSKKLEQVILRCLEKDPDLRYSSISALASDLQIELHEGLDSADGQADEQIRSEKSVFMSDAFNEVKTPKLEREKKIGSLFLAALAISLIPSLLVVKVFLEEKKNETRISLPDNGNSFPSRRTADIDSPFDAQHRPIAAAINDSDPAMTKFEQTVDGSIKKHLVGEIPDKWIIRSDKSIAQPIAPDLSDEDFKLLAADKRSTEIKNIIVDQSSVSGIGIRYLKGMPVVSLKIVSENFSDDALDSLPLLPKLRDLQIGNSKKLSLAGFKKIILSQVTSVKLLNMKIPEGCLLELSQKKNLTGLYLRNDSPTRLHANFKPIALMRNLTNLQIDGFDFSSDDIQSLKPLKKIRALALTNLDLNDRNLEVLLFLPELKSLAISNTRITKQGLAIIGQSKTIRSLYIIGCPNLAKTDVSAFRAKHPDIRVQSTRTNLLEERFNAVFW